MTSIVDVAPHAAALRIHLRSIIESHAFKGSRRSQEFLQFVVDRALAGHFDDLKERILGVELFGRSPSYDTGDDAIVRVTACDVRKRLHQFYAEFGGAQEFRIELPPGSYIPEIHNVAPPLVERTAKPGDAIDIIETRVAHPSDPNTSVPAVPRPPRIARTRSAVRTGIAILAAIMVASAFWFWKHRPGSDNASPTAVLPWSAMIQANRPIRLIFCDPEIVNVQRLLNYSVTLSDYANQRYWPDDLGLDVRRIFQSISFRGASVAAVDASMALKIDELLHPVTKHVMQVQTARSMRLGDFKTEDSFVLFGSPRSNPWVDLFQDQLDFTFEFDGARKSEFVRNKRPRNRESSTYVPTAEGWGTGQAYAIVALVANPEQNGRVLLLAGSNAEATEAAGKLTINPAELSRILAAAGIDPHASTGRFEILLRVSTMAGSPNTYEVVACHVLSGR
jgi:hypothetical protein